MISIDCYNHGNRYIISVRLEHLVFSRFVEHNIMCCADVDCMDGYTIGDTRHAYYALQSYKHMQYTDWLLLEAGHSIECIVHKLRRPLNHLNSICFALCDHVTLTFELLT